MSGTTGKISQSKPHYAQRMPKTSQSKPNGTKPMLSKPQPVRRATGGPIRRNKKYVDTPARPIIDITGEVLMGVPMDDTTVQQSQKLRTSSNMRQTIATQPQIRKMPEIDTAPYSNMTGKFWYGPTQQRETQIVDDLPQRQSSRGPVGEFSQASITCGAIGPFKPIISIFRNPPGVSPLNQPATANLATNTSGVLPRAPATRDAPPATEPAVSAKPSSVVITAVLGQLPTEEVCMILISGIAVAHDPRMNNCDCPAIISYPEYIRITTTTWVRDENEIVSLVISAEFTKGSPQCCRITLRGPVDSQKIWSLLTPVVEKHAGSSIVHKM